MTYANSADTDEQGGGWSDVAKVSCILRHRGIQLILAYSWARPAILEADKGRGGMFLFLLFLHFHSCSSFFPVLFFHLLYCLFSPSLWEMTQKYPQGLMCCKIPTQSIKKLIRVYTVCHSTKYFKNKKLKKQKFGIQKYGSKCSNF